MTGQTMVQTAPYPAELAQLVESLRYRQGWSFRLGTIDRGQDSTGLTLVITARVPDTNDLDSTITVAHYMIVPAAAYNRRSWRRWLFDQCRLVDSHEACELFMVDGSRPYAPLHGPGNDPYLVAELATDEDRRTSYRGDLSERAP